MGSYRRAIMTGFLCRLCSLYKHVVIHLYSRRARDLSLLEKIKILPVSIKKYDKLPKTVCESCVEKLCSQYEYIQQIRKNLEIQVKHQTTHANGCPPGCLLSVVSNAGASTSTSSSAEARLASSSSRLHVNENGEQISHPIRVVIVDHNGENNGEGSNS
ncbi:uncharacterized protein [Atheta coriaria]|uniref:uncharacterized protein n=1 Tax=Dalotia coriaria TaxID=877792 RepID=UPI0031F3FA73